MKILLKKAYIPYYIILFFGSVYIIMGIANHYLFKTFTWDYANYNFAFWDYSHFRISPVPTWPGHINFLQDHFSFTLMYFIPVYWALNWLTGTYTLIIIQWGFVVLAAWYSFKIIKLKTDNVWLLNGVLVYYFLLLGRYTSFSGDVNLAIISACFIPVFIYYFKIKKYKVALGILILALLSRENIPIWFIFIFVVLAIEHRKEKKAVLYSAAGIVVAVIYFVFLFKVFIPAVETEHKKFSLFNYAALGENPAEALSFVLKNPVETIKLFFINHSGDPAFNGVKTEFFIVYLISGGFVLFWRPQYLIWFIPVVAQKVLNDSPIRWSIASYYSIEVVTLLPLSVFLTLISIPSEKLRKTLVLFVCFATLSVTVYKLDAVHNKIPWALTPHKVKIYDKRFFEQPFNIRKVNQFLKEIPGDAKVSASNVIAPHLSQRKFIYFFPTVHDAQYIVFSVFDDYYLMSAEENEKWREHYMSHPEWEIVAREYPVFVLKKKNIN